jgi:hypothetical protein
VYADRAGTDSPRPPAHGSFSAGFDRLEERRRGDDEAEALSAAARFSRAFFFRWRSLRQRLIGREPRPMRRA